MSLFIAFALVPVAHAVSANGKIAFASDRDGNYEIYVMNADGSNQTRLTNNAAFDMEPSWSPDGMKIAFRSNRTGRNQVYVMNANGTTQTRVTVNLRNDIEPAFSPDGSKIVFASFHDNRYDIYVINADGTGETRLTNNPDGASSRHPSFSPDGSKIAFGFESDPNRTQVDIYVMNANGTGQTNLTNSAANEFYPSWSPDGSKIVFQSFVNFEYEIYAMDADGSNQTNLTNSSGSEELYPNWSPDGAKITFRRNCCGNEDIYVINADGSNLTQLTTNAAIDTFPSWQPLISGGGSGSDTDGDGIDDRVDVMPLTPSTRFSDVPLGGSTVGDIVSLPANTAVVIADSPNAIDGVKVTVTVAGSPLPPSNARVVLQLVGKQSQIKLAIPGTYIITDPDAETTVEVTENGPAEVVLTLNGSQVMITIAEGASATIVETTNNSNVLTDVTISGVTGDAGEVTLNGRPIMPGETLKIGTLAVNLAVAKAQFSLAATFTPSPTSNGVHPLTEEVTLNIGSYTFLIPAGSFKIASDGAYGFNGTIGGVRFSITLKTAKGGKWSLKANGKPVNGVTNSSPVSLRIGDDATS